MKIKVQNLLVIILIASVIASTIAITSSQVGSTLPYDPWRDINDDGKIDIKDLADVAARYGTLGDPVNKTTLLYNVNDTFTELLSRINELETQLEEINATIPPLRQFPHPDYDSGWTSISQDEILTFTHNLGTREVFVYMIGNGTDLRGINQMHYGAVIDTGAWWYELTETRIVVRRFSNDLYWKEVRVMIWKLPEL